jgi:ubiquinone/menaquinone biosynthesis C-methylase UbiE
LVAKTTSDSHPTVSFDGYAADYARHRRVHPGVFQALVSSLRLEARVLDVGCGTGNYAIALRHCCDVSVFGIDPSRSMLAQASERAGDVRWICGRAEALPFAAQSFDLVFSVDVVHHIADRLAAFREARRVLRPGGWFCTVTDSEEDIVRREPLSRYFPATVPVELARYPRVATIESELATAGFNDIRCDHVEHHYVVTDLEPFRSRVFSSLRLIEDEQVEAGLRHMEEALSAGPIPACSLYTLIWARAPRDDEAGSIEP